MGLLEIVTPLHKKTARDYLGRMMDDKVHCMQVARQYGQDYWDGDRRYGYGGYRYDGRWGVVAEKLIEQYRLKDGATILDVGCGKGYLLYEISQRLKEPTIVGLDISSYAITQCHPEMADHLFIQEAQQPYAFADDYFDLVISITTLHNLMIFDLQKALVEIERVGKNKYLVAESFRNDLELFNLQCWALTCQAFFRPEEWIWLFDQFSYTGDYEFIYFE